MKRFLCIALALVMVLSMAPMAFAADAVEVTSAETLTSALEQGDNIILGDSFDTTVQFIVNGDTLDGNGKTISAPNANVQPDCILESTGGGTIKNLTITGDSGKTRAIGSGSSGTYTLTGDLYIDNVTIDSVQYAINGSGTSNANVHVTNSNINGWCSFSGINSFNFTNCTLTKGNSGDGYLVIYGDTNFTNCKFKDDFDIGARDEGGKTIAAGKTVTFTNCTYNGEKVTADNFVDCFYYGTGDENDWGNFVEDCTVVIDDEILVLNDTALKNAVVTGGNIKLGANIAIDEHIDISGTVTLDLNGKTISASETWTTSSENDTPIVVKRGGNLTIKDSAGNGKIDASAKGAYSAVKMTEKGEDATGTPATLTVESGTLIGKWYGISGNGSRHDTSITIRGGTITHTETTAGCGIYHPQNGTLTIFGGEITGVTGIEMRAGTLTMKDGTVRGTASPTEVNPNGSGTTSNGAGIAVAQHTTALDLKVGIYGGTVEGYSALYESNPQKNSEDAINKVFVDIGGGTFTSVNGGTVAVYSENDRVGITGGTFSSDPTAFLKEGHKATEGDDGYTVVKTYTVTYMADGKELKTITVEQGKSVSIKNNPAIPQKEGYSFGGYYKEEEYINPWVFAEDANRYPDLTIDTVTADTILYVKYVKDVTISFRDNDGGDAVEPITAYVGKTITLPTPTHSNSYYSFDGWFTGSTVYPGGASYTVTGDVSEFLAKWTDNTPVVIIPSTPSTPPTTTDKVENEDGSVTTTVTDNKTGTVTETTENLDGSTTVVETQKDGSTTTTNTATSTETGEDGATTETKTETVEKVAADGTTTSTSTTASTTTAADGSTTTETKTEEVVKTENATTATTTTVTETAEKTESVVVKAETIVAEDGTETTSTTTTTEATLANGTTATTVVDNTGSVSAEASVSEQAIAEAAEAEAPVALPVATVSTSDAATITVATGTEEAVTVEIPMSDATTGTVAVLVNADGSETVITETALSENGVTVPVADGATIKLVDNSIDFEDVAQEEWHNDAVDYVSARGIMNGTGDNKFDPKTPTTRAMVWTMLARLDGVDTSSGENWYEAGQKWAMENGISDGTMAMEEVTREQLVTMLWRYIGEPDSDHDLSGYDDHHETSDWAKVAKQWAVENGVIKGVTDTSLDPTGEATRAQVAQMFMNFLGL